MPALNTINIWLPQYWLLRSPCCFCSFDRTSVSESCGQVASELMTLHPNRWSSEEAMRGLRVTARNFKQPVLSGRVENLVRMMN